MVVDRKLEVVVAQIREDMGIQIREQLQGFMVMFARQNQVHLSPSFPPRERSDPILSGQGGEDPILRGQGMNQRTIGTSEGEEEDWVETAARGTDGTESTWFTHATLGNPIVRWSESTLVDQEV